MIRLATVLAVIWTFAAFAVGCSKKSSGSPSATATPQCNPVGNWNVTVTYSTGNCNFTGTFLDVFTVSVNPTSGGYTLVDGSATTTDPTFTTGTDVGVNSCLLNATSTGVALPGTSDALTFIRNYTLTDTQVTGNGSDSDISVGCTQQFDVTSGTGPAL